MRKLYKPMYSFDRGSVNYVKRRASANVNAGDGETERYALSSDCFSSQFAIFEFNGDEEIFHHEGS